MYAPTPRRHRRMSPHSSTPLDPSARPARRDLPRPYLSEKDELPASSPRTNETASSSAPEQASSRPGSRGRRRPPQGLRVSPPWRETRWRAQPGSATSQAPMARRGSPPASGTRTASATTPIRHREIGPRVLEDHRLVIIVSSRCVAGLSTGSRPVSASMTMKSATKARMWPGLSALDGLAIVRAAISPRFVDLRRGPARGSRGRWPVR